MESGSEIPQIDQAAAPSWSNTR